MISRLITNSLLLLCLILASNTICFSATEKVSRVKIRELTATTSETYLIVFGTLENSFTTEMIEILHSGIPLRFSFFLELYKTTENWPDEQIAAKMFHHIMTFDTLKENYKVTLEEENNKALNFSSLFEAQKVINEINGARLVELSQLIPDNRYTLKVRAEIYQKTLPLSLNKVLPFLSWGDIETDWHTIEFNY